MQFRFRAFGGFALYVFRGLQLVLHNLSIQSERTRIAVYGENKDCITSLRTDATGAVALT